ncbi:MAG: rod shape-determining protein MreC [Acidobacteriia bacterium]|nr:rod shape-determining protein MreC [Terriglobia bacterium]
MEIFLNRYRNLTVLLVVLVAQLLLLAFQVKSNGDVRLIRVWAVTGVMPLARVVEAVRANTTGFFSEYLVLLDVKEENKRLKSSLGSLKMENQFLKTELATADRARALAAFQSRSPSRTIAARIIGTGTGANSKVVFLDRGSNAGVGKGMAVVTPDGIVGKVISSYPSASQVILITDPTFAAGVISQKSRVHGTLKGQGHSICLIEYIQNEEQVAVGEWFYTSGDDRVFPKGLPVGQVKIARSGKMFFKEVFLVPSGLQQGLEEVLVVLEGVHQTIPDSPETPQTLHLLPAPPPDPNAAGQHGVLSGNLSTDADQMLEKYKRTGAAQGHVFGQAGNKPPNFNLPPDSGSVQPPDGKAAVPANPPLR